jgi:hypothetical protein
MSDRRQALREPNTRILLAIAATLGAAGIALAAADSEDLAKVFTLIGLSAMIVGLHRYGRLGPDAPRPFSAPKKKKKRAAA